MVFRTESWIECLVSCFVVYQVISQAENAKIGMGQIRTRSLPLEAGPQLLALDLLLSHNHTFIIQLTSLALLVLTS